ncbi:hypothetical protein LEP1GSC072_1287, partial [Leptospira noguchii str. Bonito]
MSLKNSEGIGAKRTTQRLASMVVRSKLSVSLPMGRSTGRVAI